MTIYKKLDDWIQVSSKAENDAIEEVCDVIKQAIEDQVKVQDELRLRFMDFFVDKQILNYIDPPPEKLSAKEQKIDDKFSIPQLESLIEELEMICEDRKTNKIPNRDAINLLSRKSQNSKSLGDSSALPKQWNSFTRDDFEKLIRNLDIFNTGYIDYKLLATCCILLTSPVPKD